jgi:hypothetical protein
MLELEKNYAVVVMLLLKPHHSWIIMTECMFDLDKWFLVMYPLMGFVVLIV